MTAPADTQAISMDDLVSLCKRRGFIYPASEIYGGINGFWDYGPLGILLKNNLRDRWWRDMVLAPPPGPDGEELSIVGLDSSIVQNPKTWVASGHVGGFSDPMVDCRETKSRYRADHIIVYKLDGCERMYAFIENNDESAERALKMLGKYAKRDVSTGDVETIALTEMDVADYAHVVGPDTKEAGTLTEPREFNLMFETYVGAMQSEDSKAFLRPETAQGIFLNYKNVLDTMRVRVPFGIAQIGKAFRNEVTPRNFIFRSREFEQMEMEWFCHPDDAEKWYAFWRDARYNWWKSLGIDGSRLIMREHDKDELAHYAKEGAGTADVEYEYPFTSPGHGELEGVAHRGNYDLSQHAKRENAGAKLEYFDQERNERYMPHVIEPAAGLSRGVLVLLCEAFTPDDSRASKVYMKFPPSLAPIKAGVFPLVKKDGLPEIAQHLTRELRKRFGHTGLIECDEKQSIGKRYARMDEAGCPFCFTIDGDTKEDQAVTVRHRDTQEQERVGLDKVANWLGERLV